MDERSTAESLARFILELRQIDPADALRSGWDKPLHRRDAEVRKAMSRSRGFALHQALLIILYYKNTNRAFVAVATKTIEEILVDVA